MNIPLAVVLSLACAVASTGQAAESGTSSGTQKSTLPRIVLPPDKPATKPGQAPATKETKATSDAKTTSKAPAKEEKAATIPGIEIPRGKGFLGIQIVDSAFKLSFYDEKKKPTVADVDRAALRWDPKYKVGEERVVLTPSEDRKSLSSPKNIRPPYNFKLFITLIKDAAEGKEPVNETLTIDFRQ